MDQLNTKRGCLSERKCMQHKETKWSYFCLMIALQNY